MSSFNVKMENDYYYQLIVEYLYSGLPYNKQKELFDWVNASKDNKELYFRIKDIIDFDKLSKAEITPPAAFVKKITAHLESPVTRRKDLFTDQRFKFLRFAAVFLIFAIFASIWYLFLFQPSEKTVFITADTQVVKKVQLPDGTAVWLKPGSTLSYDPDFDKSERLVNLMGEAFFDVSKVYDLRGKRKPFTIQSSKFNITVLGTSFQVKDNALKPFVMVRSGTVKTTAGRFEKILHAGDKAVLNEKGLIVGQVNSALLSGWVDGIYRFDDTSIEEVAALLQQNFNIPVKIGCKECFSNVSLTGRIAASDQQSLINVLEAMLPAAITMKDNTILIKPK